MVVLLSEAPSLVVPVSWKAPKPPSFGSASGLTPMQSALAPSESPDKVPLLWPKLVPVVNTAVDEPKVAVPETPV